MPNKRNKLNELYAIWENDPSEQNLGNLLALVERRVRQRFGRVVEDNNGRMTPLHSRFQDIASKTVIKVWRALPGYPGDDPLRMYVDNGKFAAFVATVANNTFKDECKQSDNLVSLYDEKDLQYIQVGLEPGYEADEPVDFYREVDDFGDVSEL